MSSREIIAISLPPSGALGIHECGRKMPEGRRPEGVFFTHEWIPRARGGRDEAFPPAGEGFRPLKYKKMPFYSL